MPRKKNSRKLLTHSIILTTHVNKRNQDLNEVIPLNEAQKANQILHVSAELTNRDARFSTHRLPQSRKGRQFLLPHVENGFPGKPLECRFRQFDEIHVFDETLLR